MSSAHFVSDCIIYVFRFGLRQEGCAQGIGQLFASFVVGMTRDPSMKEDLFSRARSLAWVSWSSRASWSFLVRGLLLLFE